MFGENFLFPAQNASSIPVQLYHVKHAIFQLFQCLLLQKVFSKKFLTYACTGLFTSLITVLKVFEHNFLHFEVSLFDVPL